MTFRVQPVRYHFRARAPLYFPPGGAGNVFRGALGLLLRQLACDPACPGARDCPAAITCAYARCFEPRQTGDGPSGLSDLPRPFVLRAAALDGQRVATDGEFTLDVHLFDLESSLPELFGRVFSELEWTGLGPGRPRVQLERVDAPPPLALQLTARQTDAKRLRLRFVTPTEIKSEGQILAEPRFAPILARARDRVSQLAALYQEPVDFDHRGLGERARAVRLVRAEVRAAGTGRLSTRTGQRHGLTGFVGEAEYEGELGEFLPILRAAAWSGIGRHTVWGLGEIALED